MHDSELPVAIVGAGPYGLSLAAYLRARRIPFRIFGEPMLSWRQHMPRGMLLKSEGFASSLYDAEDFFTLEHYCKGLGLPYQDVGDPVPVERFCDYGLEFQRRLVPELERHEVRSIAARPRGFSLGLSTGEVVNAQHVIVATWITHFAHLPSELDGHPPELVSHSSFHADLGVFRGRTVAVIGAGSSAIDTAVLLHEAGAQVHVVARRDAISFHEPPAEPRPLLQRMLEPRSGLGTGWRSRLCTDAPLLFHMMPESFRIRVVKRHLGPAPGWSMKERAVGRFPLHLGTAITRMIARSGGVVLELARRSGGSESVAVDHVIAATGYRPALRRLPFLDQGILNRIRTADEAPVLNRYFESSVPGLYCVGLASANSFGPLTRFAYGARFTARRLTRYLTGVLHLDSPVAARSGSASVAQ